MTTEEDSDSTEESWTVEDRLDELDMLVSALRTDITENAPDGGPSYDYALGDLRSIQEQIDALLDEVSITVRIRPDYFDEMAASEGRQVRVPKSVATVRHLNSVLGVKAGTTLVSITENGYPEGSEAAELGDMCRELDDPDEEIVVSDGDQFTVVENLADYDQEAPA